MALELKQGLSLKLSQQLVMTPQLQLAIKLLQLNRLELSDMIQEQMLENPVLEDHSDEPAPEPKLEGGTAEQFAEAAPEPPAEGRVEAAKEGGDLDIPWEQMAEAYSYQPPGSNVRQGGEELPSYEQTHSRAETLTDHLLWQLKLAGLSELEQEIGSRIIGDINEQGYLRVNEDKERSDPDQPISPTQLIAADMDAQPEWVESVRQRIMRFDPLGVGALDLRECLLVQLDVLGYDDDDVVYCIVRDHLKDLENRNYKNITRKFKISMDEVGEALKIIKSLEPKPGRSFAADQTPGEAQYITPDIYVYKVGDDYNISLNEDGLPKLRISRFYQKQLQEAQARGEAKAYIRDKLRSATWLIRSIHQRQRTIYRVVESILERQRDFFDKGVEYLKPMVLQDVATDIEMHESTISRVTSNKYVHTPQGIFELKYFFNSSIRRTHGEDIASESVKNRIKQLIAEENPKKPLSDAKIVNLLKENGIEIARRTVAKYREVMGILPSSKRKRIF